MSMPLRCRCGQVRGELDLSRVYARATCYCRDCQAFARFLGGAGLLDPRGGTDVVAAAPDAIRIGAGAEQVVCMSMGPKGLLRWYAACCRTPLANTSRDPKLYYTGVVATWLDATPAEVDAALGPRDRIVANVASATAPVGSSPLGLLRVGLRVFGPVVAARLGGRRAGAPFFDQQGKPVREPEVISREERQRLQRARVDS
jgi:hypothetical protein